MVSHLEPLSPTNSTVAPTVELTAITPIPEVRRPNNATGEYLPDQKTTKDLNFAMLPIFAQLASFYTANGLSPSKLSDTLSVIYHNFRFDVVPSTPSGTLAQVDPDRFIVTESVLAHPRSDRDILPHETIHLLATAIGGFAALGRSVNATLTGIGYRTDEDAGRHRNLPPESKGDVGKAVEEALAEITKLDIFPESHRCLLDDGYPMYDRACRRLLEMFDNLGTLSGLGSAKVRQQISLLSATGEIINIPCFIENILGGYDGYGLVYLGIHFIDVGLK